MPYQTNFEFHLGVIENCSYLKKGQFVLRKCFPIVSSEKLGVNFNFYGGSFS